jgi:hypothetical protein
MNDDMTAEEMMDYLFGDVESTPKKPLAKIIYTEEVGDFGKEVPCVFAECLETGCVVGPIWGQHEGSVRRALFNLNDECTCEHMHAVDPSDFN